MRIKLYLISILLFVGLHFCEAQQAVFYNNILLELGKKVGYVPNSALAEGSYDAGKAYGLPLVTSYNSHHEVTHLGLKLFNPEVKKQFSPVVCDFVERYLLELYTITDKALAFRKMEDDKFVFIKGDLSTVKLVNENTQFSLNRLDDKYYEASWTDKGQEFLVVSFPIQYELLLGMPQIEIDKNVYEDILRLKDVAIPVVKQPQMKQLKNDVYQTVPSKSYFIESLNNSTYYRKKGDDYELLVDTAYLDYSILNLLREPSDKQNPMLMEQRVYGFKDLNWTVSLQQWIKYCKLNDYTVYAAVEEVYSTSSKILMIAECKDLGYNHVLSVIVPHNFMDNASVALQAKISAYIPTHNLKDLYQQHKQTEKKKY